MNDFNAGFNALWQQASDIWLAGGWCMAPIALTGLVLFALATHVGLCLRAKRFQAVPESTWRQWLHRPGERRGRIGELLDFVTGSTSLERLGTSFRELRTTEIAPFERDLRVIKACVAAAPLLGLLGTVTGMLTTFSALATGSGGEQTMAMVAMGISEALITTETGLVIALPGVFIRYLLVRKLDRYKAFLAHLETVCAQSLYRQLKLRGAA